MDAASRSYDTLRSYIWYIPVHPHLQKRLDSVHILSSSNFNMTIIHIVLFEWKSTASPEQVEEVCHHHRLFLSYNI